MGENNKRKLWVVSEVFYPEQVATGYIMTEIALALKEQYEVHVICGPEDYERSGSQVNYDKVRGLGIHRLNSFNFNKNKLHTRALRLVGIALGLFFKGLWHIKKNDKVFIVTNPAPLIPLYSFLKWLKGFSLVVLVHDVFPENLVTGNMVAPTNPMYKVLKRMFDKSYRKAELLVVLGRDMQEVMMGKTGLPAARIPIICNWADLDQVTPLPFNENELIRKHNLQGKIIIQYAGNHGRLQHLLQFLEVVAQVRNPILHFVFVGNGAVKKQMQGFVALHQLANVSFWEPFSRPEQNVYLNACHIGLVTLSDELYGLGVPSKTYNIFASSKPVLFIGNKDTEIAKTVLGHDCGWVFSHNQPAALTEFLEQLSFASLEGIAEKGRRARDLVLSSYSKPIILGQFKNLLS
ncbi:MAG: glycosyltransferase family 4 protein [Edaphocola sp.]